MPAVGTSLASDHDRLFAQLAAIGAGPAGRGWNRFAWTPEDRAARAWFRAAAEAVGLDVETDRNGNLWAWQPGPGPRADAVVTGSHLDTVPGGGAYDGALGVVAGLSAVAELRRRGEVPRRPMAVVAFVDEEGARFGLATFGSRLLAGALDPGVARGFRAADGTGVDAALAGFGLDGAALGADPDRLRSLGCLVEVHVEQGRALADLGTPLAVASGIWPHGRWRLTLAGEGNHAGTTRLADRRDPTLPLARAILAARSVAQARAAAPGGGPVATIGRLVVDPNSTNSVPGGVQAWLDARAPDDASLDGLVGDWTGQVEAAAAEHGVRAEVVAESRTTEVVFDRPLAGRIRDVLARAGLPAPELSTAAGHDAGALASVLPTAMIFVRNPTGISHSPAETASAEDCRLAAAMLADVLTELACR